MRGDKVEIVVDAGGVTKTYEVAATRAGRRVEVVNRRGMIEVSELTRGGTAVRTARFMASRVIALVEHPAPGRGAAGERARRANRAAARNRCAPTFSSRPDARPGTPVRRPPSRAGASSLRTARSVRSSTR